MQPIRLPMTPGGELPEGVPPQDPLVEDLRHTSPSLIASSETTVRREGQLRLSKSIGLLLWMNDHDLLDETGGIRRLAKLQRRASYEALVAACQFREFLHSNPRARRALVHHARVLNAHCWGPAEYFRPYKRRIGVGYRDKGTLPETSSRARLEVERSGWFFTEDIGFELADGFPREGDWVDLSEILTQEDSDF